MSPNLEVSTGGGRFKEIIPRWTGGQILFLLEVYPRCLVRSLRITDDGRVLLGEEGHSDSHFFLIFFDDRL